MMRFRRYDENGHTLYQLDANGYAVKRYEFDWDDCYFYVYTYARNATGTDLDVAPVRKFRRFHCGQCDSVTHPWYDMVNGE